MDGMNEPNAVMPGSEPQEEPESANLYEFCVTKKQDGTYSVYDEKTPDQAQPAQTIQEACKLLEQMDQKQGNPGATPQDAYLEGAKQSPLGAMQGGNKGTYR